MAHGEQPPAANSHSPSRFERRSQTLKADGRKPTRRMPKAAVSSQTPRYSAATASLVRFRRPRALHLLHASHPFPTSSPLSIKNTEWTVS